MPDDERRDESPEVEGHVRRGGNRGEGLPEGDEGEGSRIGGSRSDDEPGPDVEGHRTRPRYF